MGSNNLTLKPSSVFVSKSERNAFVEKFKENNPEVGTYDLSLFDISTKANKQTMEFELEFSQKPPFNVSASRFPESKLNIQRSKELETIAEDKEQAIHSINRFKMPFKGKEVPIGGNEGRFSDKKSGALPGPAQYNIDLEWNKKSYNIQFSENAK